MAMPFGVAVVQRVKRSHQNHGGFHGGSPKSSNFHRISIGFSQDFMGFSMIFHCKPSSCWGTPWHSMTMEAHQMTAGWTSQLRGRSPPEQGEVCWNLSYKRKHVDTHTHTTHWQTYAHIYTLLYILLCILLYILLNILFYIFLHIVTVHRLLHVLFNNYDHIQYECVSAHGRTCQGPALGCLPIISDSQPFPLDFYPRDTRSERQVTISILVQHKHPIHSISSNYAQ